MWLRSLLPWRRFTIETAWPPADIARELARAIGEEAVTRAGARDGESVAPGECFSLYRPVGSRSVFVLGRWTPSGAGSRVSVTVRLPWVDMWRLFVLAPGACLLAVAATMAALVRGEGVVLLVWILPVSLWLHLRGPFAEEARETEAWLRRVFPPPAPPGMGPFR